MGLGEHCVYVREKGGYLGYNLAKLDKNSFIERKLRVYTVDRRDRLVYLI
jgi:hypothetical protein